MTRVEIDGVQMAVFGLDVRHRHRRASEVTLRLIADVHHHEEPE
jgi:hypothetical protein